MDETTPWRMYVQRRFDGLLLVLTVAEPLWREEGPFRSEPRGTSGLELTTSALPAGSAVGGAEGRGHVPSKNCRIADLTLALALVARPQVSR